jgi:hypothetical protein
MESLVRNALFRIGSDQHLRYTLMCHILNSG